MTLITYMSRVHFADGVLEVALSSELELNDFSRPLLVSEQFAVGSEFIERVIAGLPLLCNVSSYEIPQNLHADSASTELLKRLHETNTDVVIAFGSALALTVGDLSCKRLHSDKQFRTDSTFCKRPKLIAVPGIDGIPTMSMIQSDDVPVTNHGAGIQPSSVIVDPTLILGESVERTSSAIADTLARCLNAYFSDGYNPPADGIAVEGINRIRRNLSELVYQDSLEMRRELMAASLNGTLSMQKETGLAQELCNVLLRDSEQFANRGALIRLLILIETELLEQTWSQNRRQQVRCALAIPDKLTVHDWLISIMRMLPLPGSLSRLGIDARQISRALEEVSGSRPTLVASPQHVAEKLANIDLSHSDLKAVAESV